MINRVRGTRDIFGRDAVGFERIERDVRAIFRLFGIQEIRTPIFEEMALFARSIGEQTDIVSKEMYVFKDRKGRDLALRPEGTASVVRFLIEEHPEIRDTLKIGYIGPMFRYERPQAGRYRQFHQFGVEYFGPAGAVADAEVIQAGWTLLQRAGVAGQVKLLINTLGGPECRPAYNEKLKNYLRARVDALCEDCRARIETNPLRCLDCKRDACRAAAAEAPKMRDCLDAQSLAHDEQLRGLLQAAAIPFEVRDTLVRGLDYYTHTVFEFITSALGAQDAVLAGGRYDGLVASMGGPHVPAVGFAAGLERLVELQFKTAGAQTDDTAFTPVVIVHTPGLRDAAFRLATRLRAESIACTLSLGEEKSIKSQMRAADKSRARAVVVLGEDEIKGGSAAVKNMKQGDQQNVPLDRLAAHLAAILDTRD